MGRPFNKFGVHKHTKQAFRWLEIWINKQFQIIINFLDQSTR